MSETPSRGTVYSNKDVNVSNRDLNIDTQIPYQTFSEHLAELRSRIIQCALAWVFCTAVVFMQAAYGVGLLKQLAPQTTIFVQLTPGEAFMASFKLAMLSGLALSMPLMLWHGVGFVSPGLTQREKKWLLPVVLLALGLFMSGVAFGYWAILPLMLDFLLGFGSQMAHTQLSIASFLDFCTGFLFATGLVFQLPLVMMALALLGFVHSDQLLGAWRYAIAASILLAAIITPSVDIFSQCLLASALVSLYGLSVMLIKLMGR